MGTVARPPSGNCGLVGRRQEERQRLSAKPGAAAVGTSWPFVRERPKGESVWAALTVQPSGEWLTGPARITLRSVELRPTSTKGSQVLQGRLATLVLERQRLRESNASAFMLEQNRIDIVQTQLELSEAFLSEHLEPRVA